MYGLTRHYAVVCNKSIYIWPIETNHISQPGHMTGRLPYCCHGTHHLPDLQYVVLRDAAQHPGFVGVPSKVWNFSCVAPMDKLEGEDKKMLLK